VLMFTDEMTRNVQVSDETFATLKSHFNEKEVVELTATVGSKLVPAINLANVFTQGRCIQLREQIPSSTGW
jgi:alkylhydroperoxidase family enzyme